MDALLLRSVIACCIATIGMEMLVMKIILVETPTVVSENTFEGVYKPKEGGIAAEDDKPDWILRSPTGVVLTGRHMIPGLCGILLAAIGGLRFSQVVGHFTNSSYGAFPSLLFGVPFGVVAGLAVNSIMDRLPLVACLFTGSAAYIGMSMWNNLVGIIFGMMVGCAVGSLVEHFGLPFGFHEGVRTKIAYDVEHRIQKAKGKRNSQLECEFELEKRRALTMDRSLKIEDALSNLRAEVVENAMLMDEYKHKIAITNEGDAKRLETDQHWGHSESNESHIEVINASHPQIETALGAPTPLAAPLEDQMGGPVTAEAIADIDADTPQALRSIAKGEACAEPVAPGALQDAGQQSPPQDVTALEVDLRPASKPASRADSKPERVHNNAILDGFELEPHGNFLGSDAGSTASSKAPSARNQQLALPDSVSNQQLALPEVPAVGSSNKRPQQAPAHVAEHPEFNYKLEPQDKDLMGRWEFREAPCDSLKADEKMEAWRQNPTVPRYLPPG